MHRLRFCLSVLVLVALSSVLALGAVPSHPVLAAPQATFDVNSTDDDPDATVGDGDCETATVDECTLRAALEEANALAGPDVVTFSITGTINLGSGLPTLTETVSIDGPGADQLTVIGDGSTPVLKFVRNDINTAFTVSGLTLGNGAGLAGGGVHQEGLSSLTITGTVIIENDADNFGGGVYHEGPATIINSTIGDNRAGRAGGGIFSAGPLEVVSGTIIENRIQGFALQAPAGGPSQAGGGIYATALFTLTGSSVLSNTITPAVATAQATGPQGCGPFTGGASPAGGPSIPRGYGIFLDSANAFMSDSDIRFNRPFLSCAESAPQGVSSIGGGLFILDSQTTIFDSRVTDNAAAYGGGLAKYGGQLDVLFSLVADNFGSGGGGGLVHDDGALLLANSQVVNNRAVGDGAGVLLGNGPAVIRDSEISLNEGTDNGGGVYVQGAAAQVTVLRSLIHHNIAGAALPAAKAVQPQGIVYDVGGGIAIDTSAVVTIAATAIYSNAAQFGGGLANNGLLTLTDVTFSGNHADFGGGGLMAGLFGATALRQVTLAYNVADDDNNGSGDGGGLFVLTPTTTLTNTLVAMNLDKGAEAPECSGTPVSGGYNLIQSTGGCTFTTTTSDQVDVVGANLLPLGDYGGNTLTHALALDSLAVNMAGAAGCTPADQRGVPRPVGTACDIGAFELAFRILLPLINR